MTPEERYDDTFCVYGVGVLCKTCVVRAIRAAEQDAHARGRAEMREECARIAEDSAPLVIDECARPLPNPAGDTADEIAAAIRALK